MLYEKHVIRNNIRFVSYQSILIFTPRCIRNILVNKFDKIGVNHSCKKINYVM